MMTWSLQYFEFLYKDVSVYIKHDKVDIIGKYYRKHKTIYIILFISGKYGVHSTNATQNNSEFTPSMTVT